MGGAGSWPLEAPHPRGKWPIRPRGSVRTSGPMAPAASQTAPEAPPSANTCALATWLVPGAGHFMLGDRRTALIGFLLIQGLYLAGVMLSDGMFLQVLPPEMRGRFAGALTPEAGNLGALLLQGRQVGFGDGIPRPFPDGLHPG